MPEPHECEVCRSILGEHEARRTIVRRRKRIPRAALHGPSQQHYVFRTKSHAFFDEPAIVCDACLDRLVAEEDGARDYLRGATLKLAMVALLVMIVGCVYGYLNPDAGPDLLTYVWHDPWAKPKPEPWQPPAPYIPYKPPFGNL